MAGAHTTNLGQVSRLFVNATFASFRSDCFMTNDHPRVAGQLLAPVLTHTKPVLLTWLLTSACAPLSTDRSIGRSDEYRMTSFRWCALIALMACSCSVLRGSDPACEDGGGFGDDVRSIEFWDGINDVSARGVVEVDLKLTNVEPDDVCDRLAVGWEFDSSVRPSVWS